MIQRMLRTGGVSLVVTVAACQGRVDDHSIPWTDGNGEDAGTGTGGKAGMDAGNPNPVDCSGQDAGIPLEEDAGNPASEDAGYCAPPPHGDGAACQASCCMAAGPVHAYTSVADYYAAIQGQWLFCDPNAVAQLGAPKDAIGIEWGPAVVGDGGCGLTGGVNCGGGNFWYLVQGPSGPVHGAGFDYELTYDVSETYPGAFQMNVHPAPNSGFFLEARYSPCPTEIQLIGMGTTPGVIVPVY